jgi:tricorn protease
MNSVHAGTAPVLWMRAVARLGVWLLAAAIAALSSAADAAEGYYRFPGLANDRVFFTAEGDLWSVPLAGGQASRLTTHPAQETNAVPSPDGRQLAFAAAYDGPVEVYVMPVAGGVPRRVSFEGGSSAPVGWTPAGEVLYVAQNETGPTGQRVIVAVDPATLARHALPLADANDAAMAPDGRTLTFTRFGLAASGDNVVAYRGGLQSRLWRFDLVGTGEAHPLTADVDPGVRGNDRRPMLWDGRLYFVSDQDGHDKLWSMALDGSDRRQLTRRSDFGIRGASLDRGHIVYQAGADLRAYDIATGGDRPIPIDLVSDFDQKRRRVVKDPMEFFEGASLAPDGKRVAVTARGRVALLGLGPLRRVDLATPPDSRARQAVISPDGRFVYVVSDARGGLPAGADDPAGVPQIWRFAADGSPDARRLTTDDAGERIGLWLSPDGKSLAHATKDGRLFLLDLDTGGNRLVDTAPAADLGAVAWSADSRHLAFVRSDSDVQRPQIFLYEPASDTRRRLTSDRYESFAPAFSPDGRWLYFLSNRTFESRARNPWGDRDMGPYFDRRTRIYALALQDSPRFPFQPKDELAPMEPPKPKDKNGAGRPTGPDIDWPGLEDRLYEVPLAAGNYRDLAVDGDRLYTLDTGQDPDHGVLKTLAIGDDDAKPQDFLANVAGFRLSEDRKQVLVLRADGDDDIRTLLILDAGAKAPADLGDATVRTSGWSIAVDPVQEWRSAFDDAWRMHRDVFFDQKMRGVDWPAIRAKYAPLVERVTDRDELNDVLGQMIAELGTLHSQIRPGDLRKAQDSEGAAFLGAVLRREPGGARIAHVYRSDVELPNGRSPLARPGVDAREGDLITAVDGQPVAGIRDIAEPLAGRAGQQVLLTLQRGAGGKAGGGKAAEIRTVAVAVDAKRNDALRYGDWEESRRAAVEAAGGGRIGYLHLRAMGRDDIAAFAREFYAQFDRDALIIDVRRNNGGNIDSWVIATLLRRAWARWQPRYGEGYNFNMQQTFRGHLAVLVDERTYSDGETFAAGVKALGLGPLIGMRTAGAGVWLSDDNQLADGGMARAAESPQFLASTGEWLIENKGVTPDIEVENLPNATFKGADAQLDAAVRTLLQTLDSGPKTPH